MGGVLSRDKEIVGRISANVCTTTYSCMYHNGKVGMTNLSPDGTGLTSQTYISQHSSIAAAAAAAAAAGTTTTHQEEGQGTSASGATDNTTI